jgi:hypothetical protein
VTDVRKNLRRFFDGDTVRGVRDAGKSLTQGAAAFTAGTAVVPGVQALLPAAAITTGVLGLAGLAVDALENFAWTGELVDDGDSLGSDPDPDEKL